MDILLWIKYEQELFFKGSWLKDIFVSIKVVL